MKPYSNAMPVCISARHIKSSLLWKNRHSADTKQGLPVSNHNYPSLLTIVYLIMSQGELKALQVGHSDAAVEHQAVRG